MLEKLVSQLSAQAEDNPYVRPLLFTIGVGVLSYWGYKQYKEHMETVILQKWYGVTQIYYPNCHVELLEIYQAIGLIPLIIKDLEKTKPNEVLERVNTRVQGILKKPCQRQSDDEAYLQLVQHRLQEAYKKAGLTETPVINTKKIERLLSRLRLDNPTNAVSEIAEIRKRLSSWITQYSRSALLSSSLSLLAQDLDAIHRHFGKRVFIKTKLGVTEVVEDPLDPERLCLECKGNLIKCR